jgi:hypothetical protein
MYIQLSNSPQVACSKRELYVFCNFMKLTGFTASTPTKRPKITYNLKASAKKPFYPKTTIKNKQNKSR